MSDPTNEMEEEALSPVGGERLCDRTSRYDGSAGMKTTVAVAVATGGGGGGGGVLVASISLRVRHSTPNGINYPNPGQTRGSGGCKTKADQCGEDLGG